MKKELLISLSVIGLMAGSNALAQTCTTPPSCETLGFTDTETDCAGGKMLKCPFDQSKVFCAGNAAANAKPGDIYYSDGTISENVILGKPAVGVVAYVNGSKGFVVALEEATNTWSGENWDVTCLTNYSNVSTLQTDMKGKTNTQCLIDDTQSHAAAEYCNSFKAVSSGKGSSGWYLPAAGELYAMSFNYDAINLSLQKLSKRHISSQYYWSSSEYSNSRAWNVIPSMGGMYDYLKTNRFLVRCVLAL